MYHHTVLLHLDQSFREIAEAEVESLASQVAGKCEGVLAYALQRNEAAGSGPYIHVLFSVFESKASFYAYDRSEVHIRLKSLLAPHLVSLLVADGEVLHG